MSESKARGLKLQGFSTKGIAGDLSAGITKSIDSVTGGMANAVLAGVNPVYGLYTVLAATPIGALFTSSVYMNIDSTGAIAATAGSMLILYPEEQRASALAVLTLLVGVFMLAAGLLKLGFLTRFISNAVLRGFLTGIGVNIILGQLGDLTGYSSEYSNKVVKAIDTALHLNQINLQIFLVGIVTIVLIVVLDRVKYINKISLLIALVVASALVPLLNLTTVPLVSSLGAMPDSLPRPVLPDLAFIPGLIAPAFALTIIALAQSAGISQAYANPDGKYPNPSQDFTGQGAANLAGALVQGLPAGGSLGGTALLVKGGAQSRWANIFTGLISAVLILLFGAAIGKLAIAALAGLLMVVGFQTIKFREINLIARTSSRARWLMIATFAATLIVPLQWAIFFGVAASFVVFAYRESESTTIVEVLSPEGGIPIEQPAPAVLPSHKVTLLYAYGSLFFAGARNLEEDLPQVDETHHAVVMLSLRGHTELGSTFITVLERYAKALQAHGNTLMLVSVNPAAYEQLKDTECLNVLGAENVFVAKQPGASTMQAFQKAQQLVQP
jgi:sulfate permease, SulP family